MKSRPKPLRVNWAFIDLVERELRSVLRRYLYDPIVKILEETGTIENANLDAIKSALKSGRVKYWNGKFTGRFSAEITKQLKALGAVWHPRTASFSLPLSKIPYEMQDFLFNLNRQFVERMVVADEFLKTIDTNKIAQAFKAKNLFVMAVKKSEQDVADVAKELAITPDEKTLKAVSKAWDYKIGADIRKWSKDEVKSLRQDLQGLIMQGKRFGTPLQPGELEEEILKRYGTKIRATIAPGVQAKQLTEKQKEKILRKANFIARNETRLLMTSYKYARMQESGSTFFRWQTVAGSAESPVRPSHKRLDGKIFRWDNPPIDIQVNKQVLPGQIYNCRCTAVPLWNEDIAKDKKGNFKQYADGSYVYK